MGRAPSGICAANAWFLTDVLGWAFRPCTTDCYGAAVTDLAIALHAAYSAARIWGVLVIARRRLLGLQHSSTGPTGPVVQSPQPFGLGVSGAALITMNAGWSAVGAEDPNHGFGPGKDPSWSTADIGAAGWRAQKYSPPGAGPEI